MLLSQLIELISDMKFLFVLAQLGASAVVLNKHYEAECTLPIVRLLDAVFRPATKGGLPSSNIAPLKFSELLFNYI